VTVAYRPARRPATHVRVLERDDERLGNRLRPALADGPALAKADHAVMRGNDLVNLGVVYARDSLHCGENRCMEQSAAPPEPVVIKVRKNGPYKVTGPVTLVDADGNEFEVPEGDGIVLCRCGGSKTKPFCDKTHSQIGFEAAERAVDELEGPPA
jgi:CDGSH iron-sulfur domain-containing protein 3